MNPGDANLELERSQPVDPLVNEVVDWAKEARDAKVVEVFHSLVAEWKAAVAHLSSTTARVQHPAYQKIIALGKPAVPLLLHELQERPNHWFAALRALTGADPVAPADRGKIDSMTDAWIRWGKAHGYL
jgi:hypothetical protein